MSNLFHVFHLLGTCLLWTCVYGEIRCDHNYDGSTGQGVIESANYPFNYDNNLDCIYQIWLGPNPNNTARRVCLIFSRFQLQETKHTDVFVFNDTQFYGNGYSDAGTHLWGYACEVTTNISLKLRFQSNREVVNTGYQATYLVEEVVPGAAIQDKQYAPCNSTEWMCPDRKCIAMSKLCDGQIDCSDIADESYTHARCGVPRLITGMVACDFTETSEIPCRTWSNWKSGWIRETASGSILYGPSNDHTGGDIPGLYLRTEFKWTKPDSFIYVVEAGNVTEDYFCLSFYYHMKGKDAGRLNVYWGTSELPKKPLWSRRGNHGEQWHRGQLQFAYIKGEDSQVDPHFEVRRGGEIDTQIALDDISIMKGPCINIEDISCNFERENCGWMMENMWLRESPEYSTRPGHPPTDSSSAREDGHYIYLDSRTGTLTSPVISVNVQGCFSFYHYVPREYNYLARISVLQLVFGTSKPPILYTASLAPNAVWDHTVLDVPAVSAPYQIQVKVEYYHDSLYESDARIFLDEFSLIFDECDVLDLETCSPNEFRCNDLSDCIPAYLKCDGIHNCRDASDEAECDTNNCDDRDFQCANGMCISSGKVCNNKNDCGDNSDEAQCSSNGSSFFGNFTVAAIASVISACLLIIIIIMAKIIMCYYKRRARTPRVLSGGGWWQRRESVDATTQQPPPAYDLCADNLETYPKPQRDEEVKVAPPSYDLVQNEHYVQITVPIEDEIRKMKEEMASRLNANDHAVPHLNAHDNMAYDGEGAAAAYLTDNDTSVVSCMNDSGITDDTRTPASSMHRHTAESYNKRAASSHLTSPGKRYGPQSNGYNDNRSVLRMSAHDNLAYENNEHERNDHSHVPLTGAPSVSGSSPMVYQSACDDIKIYADILAQTPSRRADGFHGLPDQKRPSSSFV